MTLPTRKSMSLQDYGIMGSLSRVTRDPLIIALFEGCRYRFQRRSFILRYLNLTRRLESRFDSEAIRALKVT